MIYRKYYLGLLLLTLVALAASWYLEYAKGWQPCPLCLMQRGCTLCIGFFILIAINATGRTLHRTLAFISVIAAIAGIFFSIRQLWLQTLEVHASGMCMPGLDTVMHYFSWDVAIKALFWGTSSCSEPAIHLLGVAMPVWSMIYFFVILITIMYCTLQADRFRLK